jgi:hypothetical protein
MDNPEAIRVALRISIEKNTTVFTGTNFWMADSPEVLLLKE